MEINRASSYTKHGCNIVGDLVIVELSHLLDTPTVHNFGRMNCFDLSNEALKLVKKEYGEVERVLAIPDLVCRIIKK